MTEISQQARLLKYILQHTGERGTIQGSSNEPRSSSDGRTHSDVATSDLDGSSPRSAPRGLEYHPEETITSDENDSEVIQEIRSDVNDRSAADVGREASGSNGGESVTTGISG